jgi:hypothetical protein
MYVVII